MIKVNEYFEGNVKSLAVENKEAKATVGVIEPGEYEFGTSTVEIMQVVSGEMKALLPGRTDWIVFKSGQDFRVEKNQLFKVMVTEPVAYYCKYM